MIFLENFEQHFDLPRVFLFLENTQSYGFIKANLCEYRMVYIFGSSTTLTRTKLLLVL